MKRIVTVMEMQPREVRCVVLAELPIVVLRHATLLERFVFWLAERREPVKTWLWQRTNWRSRSIAKEIIERART